MNSHKSRTHFTALNMSANVLGFGINLVLGFVCRIIFVRYLSADYLGLSGLFTNVISMLSLAELGIGGAITYALYEPLAKNDVRRTSALVALFGKIYKGIGIIVAVLGVAFAPFLHVLFKEPPRISENVTVIYLFFLFSTSVSYFASHKISVLRAAQKDYLVTGSSYINTIVMNLLQILVLIFTANYMYYLYLQVLFGIIYLIWISSLFRKNFPQLQLDNPPKISREEQRDLLKNVWAISVQRLGGVLVNSTDNMIISRFVGIVAVGLLSNYMLLISTLQGLISNLLISSTASIGNYNVTEDKISTEGLLQKIQFFLFSIYGWLAIVVFFVSHDLVVFLFGEKYVMSTAVSMILAINFYMVGMQTVLWTFRNAMGLFNFKKYLLLVTAVINLVLSVILGKLWGVFGVLLATAIARICTNWWYDPVVVFNHGLKTTTSSYYRDYFRYASITFATAALLYFPFSLMHFSAVINLILKTAVLTLLFFGFVYALFCRTEKFAYALLKLNQIAATLRHVVAPMMKYRN